MNNLHGNIFDTPYKIGGSVSNNGKPSALLFKMNGVRVNNLYSVINSKVFPDDVKKLLDDFELQDGTIDISSYIENNDIKANIKFHDATVKYKKSGEIITAKSGEFFFSKDSNPCRN